MDHHIDTGSGETRERTVMGLTSLILHEYFCENNVDTIEELFDRQFNWIGIGGQGTMDAGAEDAAAASGWEITDEEYTVTQVTPEVYLCTGQLRVCADPEESDSLHQRVTALYRWTEDEVHCVHLHLSNPGALQGDAPPVKLVWDDDADDEDIDEMLRQADEMWESEMDAFSPGGVGDELRKELEDNRFMVYYQPQVNLKTGAVTGAEALVRKRDEAGNIVPPMNFLPLYEAGGVISLVDLFVLKTACEALRRWMDEGYFLHVTVNFSRLTLSEWNIVEVISGICEEHNVPPFAIVIDVTENMGKMDHEHLKILISRLQEAGFSISLDNFGSKYSNLSILSAMDFNMVTFDRTLISTLEENHKSRAVMKNGVLMCRELGDIATLAEGIETKGQLDLLLEFNCDWGQGFYFSKPLPQEEFDKYLKNYPQQPQ